MNLDTEAKLFDFLRLRLDLEEMKAAREAIIKFFNCYLNEGYEQCMDDHNLPETRTYDE